MKMKSSIQISVSPAAEESCLKPGDPLLKEYRLAILHRVMVTIYVPVFVWLFLETFFK
jgi:hypothetical protein